MSNTNRYNGGFSDALYEGHGSIEQPSGGLCGSVMQYVGQFRGGVKDGKGLGKCLGSNILWDGEWCDGYFKS
jgi:hypothetical protein